MVRDANGRIQAIVGDIPRLLVSSVLGAVSVVTFTSYNFSTGGKQHGSLFRSFIERYMKISFSGVFFVFSFNHQIIQVKCFGIYKLESVRSMVNVFQNFLVRTADFYQKFLWFSYISSLSFHLSASSSVIFLCNATLVGGVSSYVVSSVAVPPSPINIFSPNLRFVHDLVLFRIVSCRFFFSFFLTSFPKGSTTLCMKNNCCMYA